MNLIRKFVVEEGIVGVKRWRGKFCLSKYYPAVNIV
jgi:hypothetical protein